LCDGDSNFYTDCDYTSVADAYGYSHGYRATQPYADGYSYGYIYDHAECYRNGHSYSYCKTDAHRPA
jgi:hypothetical protein